MDDELLFYMACTVLAWLGILVDEIPLVLRQIMFPLLRDPHNFLGETRIVNSRR